MDTTHLHFNRSWATTVNPYLAIDSIYQRFEKKLFGKSDFETCVINLKNQLMLVF